MPIEALTSNDLELLHELQPPDWNPLALVFDFYLRADFCFPIKYTERGAIAGIGATIIHKHTAWLEHIIVHNEHRNKGIGGIVTKALIDQANKSGIQTVLLLATSLGEPVYKKHGFIKEMDYLFFKTDQDISFNNSYTISSFEEKFIFELLQLDKDVSGEDLAWFWRGWFLHNWQLDQAVREVKYVNDDPAKGALITIDNLEKMPIPVELELKTVSGKTSRIKLPVEVWERNTSWTFKAPVEEALESVVLDPDKALPDMNAANNSWKSGDKKGY